MTTITIPPELEAPLAQAAKRHGTSPELLAVESLRRMYALASSSAEPTNSGTAADFLQGYIGTIEGTNEPLSEDTGRRFSEMLVEKRQENAS